MEFIFIILILLFSVVIHEVSHGYAALWLGDPTAKYEGRLTLNPISHIDPVGSILVPLIGFFVGGVIIGWAKPVPFNPYNLSNKKWGEAIVALAGPLSNIIMAIVFALIIRGAAAYGVTSEGFFFLSGYLVFINIVLALFNLIPIPPLDGSKILFAILPYHLQHLRTSVERWGLPLVFLFVFVLWPFLSPAASVLFKLLVGSSFF
ncbi:MAG TPA: site-2 protease family protein [Candidatus Paceibacterota bacterium]